MANFWVHCSKCFLSPSPNVKFYITSCEHILCEKCMEKQYKSNECPKCKCVSPSLVALSTPTVPPHIRIFFTDVCGQINNLKTEVTRNLNLQNKLAKHLIVGMKGKSSNKKKMLDYGRQQHQKLTQLKQNCSNGKEAYTKLVAEESFLRQQLASLERTIGLRASPNSHTAERNQIDNETVTISRKEEMDEIATRKPTPVPNSSSNTTVSTPKSSQLSTVTPTPRMPKRHLPAAVLQPNQSTTARVGSPIVKGVNDSGNHSMSFTSSGSADLTVNTPRQNVNKNKQKSPLLHLPSGTVSHGDGRNRPKPSQNGPTQNIGKSTVSVPNKNTSSKVNGNGPPSSSSTVGIIGHSAVKHPPPYKSPTVYKSLFSHNGKIPPGNGTPKLRGVHPLCRTIPSHPKISRVGS